MLIATFAPVIIADEKHVYSDQVLTLSRVKLSFRSALNVCSFWPKFTESCLLMLFSHSGQWQIYSTKSCSRDKNATCPGNTSGGEGGQSIWSLFGMTLLEQNLLHCYVYVTRILKRNLADCAQGHRHVSTFKDWSRLLACTEVLLVVHLCDISNRTRILSLFPCPEPSTVIYFSGLFVKSPFGFDFFRNLHFFSSSSNHSIRFCCARWTRSHLPSRHSKKMN